MVLIVAWLEYVILGFALVIVLGLIFYLFEKLTPKNWDSLKGGLGGRFSNLLKIAVVIVIAVFLVLFLLKILG